MLTGKGETINLLYSVLTFTESKYLLNYLSFLECSHRKESLITVDQKLHEKEIYLHYHYIIIVGGISWQDRILYSITHPILVSAVKRPGSLLALTGTSGQYGPIGGRLSEDLYEVNRETVWRQRELSVSVGREASSQAVNRTAGPESWAETQQYCETELQLNTNTERETVSVTGLACPGGEWI